MASAPESMATSNQTAASPGLAFLHVPKTGGTTLAKIIRRQYTDREICDVSFDRAHTIDDFLATTEAERASLRCVEGHFPFGIHELMPQVMTYVAILREPEKRFISEYFFLRDNPQVRGDLPIPEDELTTFGRYLDYCIGNHAMNEQTRQIAGLMPLGPLSPPFEPLPADAVDIALANISGHFTLVGTLDRFDETALLLQRRLGWTKGVTYIRKNIASSQGAKPRISAEDRDKLRDHVVHDRRLFEIVSQNLEQAIAAEGSDFAAELQRFRRTTGLLFRLQGYYHRIFPRSVRRGIRRVLGRRG